MGPARKGRGQYEVQSGDNMRTRSRLQAVAVRRLRVEEVVTA